MPRVVLDTVVFVCARINPHSHSGRLLTDLADRYSLAVSKPTAQELLEVIHRPELSRKYRSLRRLDARRVIDLLSQAEAVQIGDVPPVSRDPKDDILLATATAADADYLVSEDKDLLVLGSVGKTRIVDVATFIRALEEGE